MKKIIFLLIGFISITALNNLFSKEIIITPDSAKNGLQNIISSLKDGDSVIIKKGIYKDSLLIENSINIVGEKGAVLNPSEKLSLKWENTAGLGKSVYRVSVPKEPVAIFFDGKPIARLDEKRAAASKKEWSWESLIRYGAPSGAFKYIKGLFIYITKEKTLYLHLENDINPDKVELSVLWEKKNGITFKNASNASVTGLKITHAFNGVVFSEKSNNCRLSKCIIDSWEMHGVFITGGSSECAVESNDIFRNSLENWTPTPYSVDDTTRRIYYEVWQIHKNTGYYDRIGVYLFRSGINNKVYSNHIHETFDGIDIGDYAIENNAKPMISPDDNKGSEIFDNLIENTRDSGIELGTGCIDVKVHNNYLVRTHGGLRFKLPRIGPVYIYRNYMIDGRPFNIWFSMDDSTAEGYVYHNTIVGGSAALMYSSMPDGVRKTGAPNWHFYNNLFVAENGFFLNKQKPSPPVNFICDYNLTVGSGKPYEDGNPNDAHSLYLYVSPLTDDFPPLPKSGSKAIDTGVDLSSFLKGKILPGCGKKYFKGKAPDLGAYEKE